MKILFYFPKIILHQKEKNYSSVLFAVFGCRSHNWNTMATTTKPASIAISRLKLPESADLPRIVVIKAPAEIPAIFINPYPVARKRGETNWHKMGMLLTSKIPKPKPKSEAPHQIAAKLLPPNPSSITAGIVIAKPTAPV